LVAAHRGTTRREEVARRRIILLIKATREYCRSQKRVTVADRRMTRCARVAWLRRRQPKKECSKGTRSRDVEELLHLRKGRKTAKSIEGRDRRQQSRLETMKKQ
jgi:hypothetical protein